MSYNIHLKKIHSGHILSVLQYITYTPWALYSTIIQYYTVVLLTVLSNQTEQYNESTHLSIYFSLNLAIQPNSPQRFITFAITIISISAYDLHYLMTLVLVSKSYVKYLSLKKPIFCRACHSSQ